jgi:hypothetical protein
MSIKLIETFKVGNTFFDDLYLSSVEPNKCVFFDKIITFSFTFNKKHNLKQQIKMKLYYGMELN